MGYERIVYDKMKDNLEMHLNMNTHLQLYTFAHVYLYKKTVIDAACGTCFGSMVYSTAAKSIICVDKSEEAIEYGKKLPMFCPTVYLVKNLDKVTLPEADVCVSMETIEHLDGKGFFLKHLKVKELVFSIPIDMPGGHHKLDFKTPEDAVKYLNNNGWEIVTATVHESLSTVELGKDIPSINIKSGKGLLRATNLMGVAQRYETKRKDKGEERVIVGRRLSR